jgi:hypothetical protein
MSNYFSLKSAVLLSSRALSRTDAAIRLKEMPFRLFADIFNGNARRYLHVKEGVIYSRIYPLI